MSRIPIDTAEIRALAEILADTGLTEIELVDGESRIRVARMPAPVPAAPPVAYAPPPVPAAAASSPAPAALASDPADIVTSPMVGIAYLAPEPGQAPFVTVGQPVAAGQTVLLIEAMKTFNQIKAPKAGTVARILVSSGQPVEYGEGLLVIE